MVQFMTNNDLESLSQSIKGVAGNKSIFINEFKKAPTQTDEQGFFHSYYTTSTKKPYVWNKFDVCYGVSPANYEEYFLIFLGNVQKAKEEHDWTGYKIVGVTMDLLNPHFGMSPLVKYCTEVFSPKKKTYINGVKANQEFLAKKGKLYV